MRRKSAELKRIARGNLMKNFGIPMGAMVVASLMQTIPLLFFSRDLTIESGLTEWIIYYVAAFVIGLLGIVLSVGNIKIALHIGRKQEYRFTDLFYGFTHHPDRYLLAEILIDLLILLVMTPGIVLCVMAVRTNGIGFCIAAIVFLLAGYVGVFVIQLTYGVVLIYMLDHEQVKVMDALRASKALMRGNKGRLFYIELSFIGIQLLGALSFGVGYLWISPYILQTKAVFYLELTGEYDRTEETAQYNEPVQTML